MVLVKIIYCHWEQKYDVYLLAIRPAGGRAKRFGASKMAEAKAWAKT